MNEMKEQHDAQTRGSLHKITIALAHLWLTNTWANLLEFPHESTYWVYPHHLDWGEDLLTGKRIKVTIEIEDWNPIKKAQESEKP